MKYVKTDSLKRPLTLFIIFLILAMIVCTGIVAVSVPDFEGKISLAKSYYGYILNLLVYVLLGILIVYYYRILFQLSKTITKNTIAKILAVGLLSIFYFDGFHSVLIKPISSPMAQIGNSSVFYDEPEPVENSFLFSEPETEEEVDLEAEENVLVALLNTSMEVSVEKIKYAFQLVYRIFEQIFIHYVRSFFLGLVMLLFLLLLMEYLVSSKKKVETWLISYKVSIVFFLIFVVGMFLGMSSIIAIPVLNRDKEFTDLDATALRENLERSEKNLSDITDYQLEFATNDVSTTLNELQLRIEQLSTDSALAANSNRDIGFVTYSMTQALSDIGSWMRYLENQKSEINEAIEDYNRLVLDKKNEVISSFETELLNRNVGEERVVLYKQLNNYYVNYLQEYQIELSYRVSDIKRNYEFNKRELDALQLNLDYESNALIDFFRNGEFYLRPGEYVDWDIENYLSDYYYSPVLQAPSEDIFYQLASWLINSRSDEMILISGMLGFGLLGAGISSLIRRKKYDSEESFFRSNVTSTLIGGFSASLVVFLSAKGGMAILSSDTSNLNPYTLLFFCFVGSVYSEVVWERVKRQFENNEKKIAAEKK